MSTIEPHHLSRKQLISLKKKNLYLFFSRINHFPRSRNTNYSSNTTSNKGLKINTPTIRTRKAAMVSHTTWLRYLARRFEYSLALSYKSYEHGKISNTEVGDNFWKTFFQGKLTFLHWNKGAEMAPTIASEGGTLLVRKLPAADPQRVYVGDVVVMKDPENSDNYLVRRLAAIEGYEMVSKDEKDEPFLLEKDQCWVLADNDKLKPQEAKDSRLFGPVSMNDIIGRVLYCLRTAVDHGPIQNSQFSMQKDLPVLEVELDVDEMAKNHKA